MSPRLRIVVPKSADADVILGGSTAIGRLDVNQLFFPDDPLISRQHALIRHQGGDEFVLIDLGSSNGTFLNSKLLLGPTPLNDGDEILVGSVLLRFVFPSQLKKPSGISSDQPDTRTMVGVRVSHVVVMVCDIRNFTPLSELLTPEELARFIGVWFREVAVIINDAGGVVDKYIGDAFMAYWRVDKAKPEDAARTAVGVAVRLLELVRATELPRGLEFEFKVGMGLNEGVVASSNMGASSQRDSSIMGDAVNTAFRVESACKELGCSVLMTGPVYEHAKQIFECISYGPVVLKGKSEPILLYGLSEVLAGFLESST